MYGKYDGNYIPNPLLAVAVISASNKAKLSKAKQSKEKAKSSNNRKGTN